MLSTFPTGILSKFPHAKFVGLLVQISIQLGLNIMILLTLMCCNGVKATRKR